MKRLPQFLNKRLLPLMLAFVMIFLVACGDVDPPGGGDDPYDNGGIGGPGAGVTVTEVVVTAVYTTLHVGSTVQLAASVQGTGNPAQTVTWYTGTDTVASVSPTGLVTALGVGTSIITARSAVDTGATGTVTVVVVAPGTPIARQVVVTPPTSEIDVLQNIQLAASVQGAYVTDAHQGVTWTTSNAVVAAVDMTTGMVTGSSQGTATITATSTLTATVYGIATITVRAPEATSVVIASPPTHIDREDQVHLGAAVHGRGLTPGQQGMTGITWSSSNPTVATITPGPGTGGGVLLALTTGTTVIRATSTFDESVYSEATITVEAGVPTATQVTVAPGMFTLYQNQTRTLAATVQGVRGHSQNVTWESSAPGVATVDPVSGLITAVAASGTARIYAISTDTTSVRGYATLTINAARVSNITLAEPAHFSVGSTVRITAAVQGYGVFSNAVNWSFSEDYTDYITVTNVGGQPAIDIYGVDEGIVAITATSVTHPSVYYTITITVAPRLPHIISITVTPDEHDFYTTSAPFQLGVTVERFLADEAADWGLGVNWHSEDTSIVTVSPTGMIVAVAPGTTYVYATSQIDSTVYGRAEITVNQPNITGVNIAAPPSPTVQIGGTPLNLTAQAVGNGAINQAVTWYSDNAHATVVNGVVTGVSVGTAVIRAVAVGNTTIFSTVAVEVTAAAVVESVAVTPSAATIYVGGATTSLSATVVALHGATNAVTWHSDDTGIATVDNNGVVTAVAPGEVRIYATSTFDTNVTGFATITVSAPVVDTITLPNDFTITAGLTLTFNAVVAGRGSVDTRVTFSTTDTAGAVATVVAGSEAGQITVTGVAPGTLTITVASHTHPGVTASVVVTVGALEITSVTVAPAPSALYDGQTVTLSATVTAAVGTAPNVVTWHSGDTDIATVGRYTGVVTAVAPGSVSIYATSAADTNVSGSTTIVVNNPRVTGVTIASPTDLTIRVDGTLNFSAVVDGLGSFDNTIRWETNNANATVVGGLVTGMAIGTVRIYAIATADNDVYAYVDLNVLAGIPVVDSVTISAPSNNFYETQTIQLAATVVARHGATSDVVWEFVDPIYAVRATLTGDGLVTAVYVGNAGPSTIRVRAVSAFDGNVVSNYVALTINPPRVTAITVTGTPDTAFNLDAEGTIILGASVTGYGNFNFAGRSDVTWETSNPAHATVDGGVVTATNVPGVAVIRARSVITTTVFGYVTITVVPRIDAVAITAVARFLQPNGTVNIAASVQGVGFATQNVVWRSGNDTHATVVSTGTNTALITAGTQSATVRIYARSFYDVEPFTWGHTDVIISTLPGVGAPGAGGDDGSFDFDGNFALPEIGITGRGDHPNWAQVTPIVTPRVGNSGPGMLGTTIRAFRGRYALFIHFDVQDDNLRTTGGALRDQITQSDSVELFINNLRSRSASTGYEMNFAINGHASINTHTGAMGASWRGNWGLWNGLIDYEIYLDGTLNAGEPGEDIGYGVEVMVPWAQIGLTYTCTVGLSFGRVERTLPGAGNWDWHGWYFAGPGGGAAWLREPQTPDNYVWLEYNGTPQGRLVDPNVLDFGDVYVTGTISDQESGAPIGGARIFRASDIDAMGQPIAGREPLATASAGGAFQMAVASNDNHSFAFVAEGFGTGEMSVTRDQLRNAAMDGNFVALTVYLMSLGDMLNTTFTGSVRNIVRGQVANATVAFFNPSSSILRQTTTDGSGHFILTDAVVNDGGVLMITGPGFSEERIYFTQDQVEIDGITNLTTFSNPHWITDTARNINLSLSWSSPQAIGGAYGTDQFEVRMTRTLTGLRVNAETATVFETLDANRNERLGLAFQAGPLNNGSPVNTGGIDSRGVGLMFSANGTFVPYNFGNRAGFVTPHRPVTGIQYNLTRPSAGPPTPAGAALDIEIPFGFINPQMEATDVIGFTMWTWSIGAQGADTSHRWIGWHFGTPPVFTGPYLDSTMAYGRPRGAGWARMNRFNTIYSAPNNDTRGTVTGNVSRQDTGANIGGATIDVGGMAATSNAGGNWTVANVLVPSGAATVDVAIRANGFHHFNTTIAAADFDAAEVTARVDAQMVVRHNTIVGEVVSVFGGPVEDVRITATAGSANFGPVYTDAAGEWELTNVTAFGALTVTAEHPAFENGQAIVTVAAQNLLPVGATITADVITLAAESVDVSGTVSNIFGVYLEGAVVDVVGQPGVTTTNEYGEWAIAGVGVADVTFRVTIEGYIPRYFRLSAQELTNLNGDSVDIDMHLPWADLGAFAVGGTFSGFRGYVTRGSEALYFRFVSNNLSFADGRAVEVYVNTGLAQNGRGEGDYRFALNADGTIGVTDFGDAPYNTDISDSNLTIVRGSGTTVYFRLPHSFFGQRTGQGSLSATETVGISLREWNGTASGDWRFDWTCWGANGNFYVESTRTDDYVRLGFDNWLFWSAQNVPYNYLRATLDKPMRFGAPIQRRNADGTPFAAMGIGAGPNGENQAHTQGDNFFANIRRTATAFEIEITGFGNFSQTGGNNTLEQIGIDIDVRPTVTRARSASDQHIAIRSNGQVRIHRGLPGHGNNNFHAYAPIWNNMTAFGTVDIDRSHGLTRFTLVIPYTELSHAGHTVTADSTVGFGFAQYRQRNAAGAVYGFYPWWGFYAVQHRPDIGDRTYLSRWFGLDRAFGSYAFGNIGVAGIMPGPAYLGMQINYRDHLMRVAPNGTFSITYVPHLRPFI